MDSLTQIVLGAACGEVVLGKKIGNRALLFGAIGGTIPDLDVIIGNLVYSHQIDAMAFHRGFMHSILFSIIGTFLFGWLFFKIYDTGKRKTKTTLKDWQKLCFWSLLTHPILDCFTPYGTQLFSPFLDYRVAFNSIAVADPLYTLPFLICIIIVMFYKRLEYKRRLFLKLGFVISSLYMAFTVVNKVFVNSVFETSFVEDQINIKRYRTQPTIFNNILWYGIAETQTDFYLGFYSLLDKEKKIKDWKIISKGEIPINMSNPDLATLAWFSDDYYSVIKTEEDNVFLYKDLRYSLLNPDDKNSSLFSFKLYKNENRWDIKNSRPDFEKDSKKENILKPFLDRLKGI